MRTKKRSQRLVAKCGCHLVVELVEYSDGSTDAVDVVHSWSCFSHGAPPGGYY
ncbi:hypothetical protein FREDWARD_62 [Mycobacterium phage Fredward]|uniref:hypothetical protein n=1 Tax=Mycobacterium phage Fredward TaxID=1354510 RepID=UPI0003B9FB91|nr:hypothetical protein V424_gp050 [Mycobacterium phage Fredward]AGY37005.1 hypothetical protein FREDWARD_62 [Mycobacterium phage Fredward]